MLASLKRKWIKALRSGKYKQGNGSLFDGSAHCCLGVLARAQGARAKKGSLIIGGEPAGTSREFLAKQFACGLHTKTQARLAAMNDGTGSFSGKRKTFDQIADFIERNY